MCLCCGRGVGRFGDRQQLFGYWNPELFQQITQFAGDFRALNNGPSLGHVAHRVQRSQQVGDARPRQAGADLGGALHLQRQHAASRVLRSAGVPNDTSAALPALRMVLVAFVEQVEFGGKLGQHFDPVLSLALGLGGIEA